MKIVGQSDKIEKNLHAIFTSNYEKIKDLTYEVFVSYLIDKNEIVFDLTPKEFVNELDENDATLLKDSLKNFKLSSTFEKLVKFDFDEYLIKKNLKEDLTILLSELKSKNSKEYAELKRQVLFISYGDFPYSWGHVYGKGDFPILSTPEYFRFDHSNELFIPNQYIHFQKLWQPMLDFEELVNKLDLYNQLMNDSDLYQCIYNSYKFKYFILLNEVFSENEKEIFSDFPITKPFYIFGNQHDGENINLHILE